MYFCWYICTMHCYNPRCCRLHNTKVQYQQNLQVVRVCGEFSPLQLCSSNFGLRGGGPGAQSQSNCWQLCQWSENKFKVPTSTASPLRSLP